MLGAVIDIIHRDVVKDGLSLKIKIKNIFICTS